MAFSYIIYINTSPSKISFIEAKNGEEAFELVVAAVTSFELIITDIQMPICNGFEFTRKVRRFVVVELCTEPSSHPRSSHALDALIIKNALDRFGNWSGTWG